MKRAGWWPAARELRSQGWSYPRIAAALGVHHTSVMFACDPAYRQRKRAGNKLWHAVGPQ